jgi:thioredoxin 1
MSDKIKEITDGTFDAETKSGLVLVDFWAPWCGPCRMLAPVLEELAGEMGGKLKVVKINVDDNGQSASNFGITSIPTLILFKDGKKVESVMGVQSKQNIKKMAEKFQ